MFERFTPAARAAVVDAQQQARELGAEEVTAEHLLLALAAGGDPVAAGSLGAAGASAEALRRALAEPDDAGALRALGVDLDAVRRSAEAAFGAGALERPRRRRRGLLGRLAPGHLPFTDPAKEALEQCLRAALDLGDRSLAPAHVLLGLLASDRTPAAHLLHRAGADPAAVRADVLRRRARAA